MGSEISSPYGVRTSARSNIVDNVQSNIIAVPIYGSINQESKNSDSYAIQNLDIKHDHQDNVHDLFKYRLNDKGSNQQSLQSNSKSNVKKSMLKQNINQINEIEKASKIQKIIKEPIGMLLNKRNEESQKDYMEIKKNNLSTISSKKVLKDEINESDSIDIELKSSHIISSNKDEINQEIELRQDIDSDLKYFKLGDDKNQFSKQTLREDDNVYPKQIKITKFQNVSDATRQNINNQQINKQDQKTNLQVNQQNKRANFVNISNMNYSSNDQNSQKTFQQTNFRESRPTILTDSTPNLNKDTSQKNKSLLSSQPLLTQMVSLQNLPVTQINQNSGQFEFNRDTYQNQMRSRPMTSKHKQNNLSLYTTGLRKMDNNNKQIYISSKSPSNSDAFNSQNIEVQGKKINNIQDKIISSNRTISFSPTNLGFQQLKLQQNMNKQNMAQLKMVNNKNSSETNQSISNRKQIKILNNDQLLRNFLSNNNQMNSGLDIPQKSHQKHVNKKPSLDHTLLLGQSIAEQQYLIKQQNEFQQYGNLLSQETPDSGQECPDPVATFQKYNKKLIARQFFSPTQNLSNSIPINLISQQSKQLSSKYRRKQQTNNYQGFQNNRDSYDQSISHINKKGQLRNKNA